uniref:Farnesyl pyrophosphate synthase n=1 Tax=Acrobeloides nanus TaxID=290746 RepID=A0A914CH89_9BILA
MSLKGSEVAIYSERIKYLFDYTMANGKYARSSLALDTYKALTPNASQEKLVSAAKVCSSIELMQTFYLIIDDIMDDAKLRRGKPCWHTLPGIGLNAINDGLLLDCSIDWVIREAIPQHPHQATILQTLYE